MDLAYFLEPKAAPHCHSYGSLAADLAPDNIPYSSLCSLRAQCTVVWKRFMSSSLQWTVLVVNNYVRYYIPISCLQCLDFWEACEDGDIDTVWASLSAGVDVNIATPVS